MLAAFFILLVFLFTVIFVYKQIEYKQKRLKSTVQTTLEPWDLDEIIIRKDADCLKEIARLLNVSPEISFKDLEKHCRDTADHNISSFSLYFILKERGYRRGTSFSYEIREMSLNDINFITDFSDIERLCFKYDPSFENYLKIKFKSILSKD